MELATCASARPAVPFSRSVLSVRPALEEASAHKHGLPPLPRRRCRLHRHAQGQGRRARDRARLRPEERRPRCAAVTCCATLPTRAPSRSGARSCTTPAPSPPSCSPTSPSRDRDGELIAVPTEWDTEEHGEAPRIRVHVPRKARSSEVPGVGDRALLRTEESAEEGPIRHTGRVIKILDRSRQRQLGVFRAAPERRRTARADRQEAARPRARRSRPAPRRTPKDGDLVAVELTRHGRLGLPTAQVKERLGSLQVRARRRASSRSTRTAFRTSFAARRWPRPRPRGRPGSSSREDWRDAAARHHRSRSMRRITTTRCMPSRIPIRATPADFIVTRRDRGRRPLRDGPARRSTARRWCAATRSISPTSVVPMLPERISNDLCSLRPERGSRRARRPAWSSAPTAASARHSFHRVLMRSAAKLHYAQAQDGRRRAHGRDHRPLRRSGDQAALRGLRGGQARARGARSRSISTCPSARSCSSQTARSIASIVPPRLDAHRLIEEFMILANVAAAETLERARAPLIYRVHDEPAPEKLEALREFLATLDITLRQGSGAAPGRLQQASSRA